MEQIADHFSVECERLSGQRCVRVPWNVMASRLLSTGPRISLCHTGCLWQEEPRRAGLLPKTFKVPVDDSYREKKHKKSKKSKDKDREPEDKQASDDRAVEEAAAPTNGESSVSCAEHVANFSPSS